MSADPFIQSPDNLQSHNRYAYVLNNPLGYTDPSGYFFKRLFRGLGKIFNAIVPAPIRGMVMGFIATTACGPYAPLCLGAMTSISAYGAGASTRDALRAGMIAGGTALAFNGAGDIFKDNPAMGYLAHAGVGCVSSVAGGGQCGQGAASAVFGKYATVQIGASLGVQSGEFNGYQFAATVVAGGVGSVLAGGKFENGAQTAAFGYLFNWMSEYWKQGAIGAVKTVGGALTVSTGATLCGTTGVGCLAGAPMMAFGASDAIQGATMIVDAYEGVTSQGLNPLKAGIVGLLPNAGALVYDSASLAFNVGALGAQVPLYVGASDGISRASSLFGLTTSRWDAASALANSVTGQAGQMLNRATLAGSALWKAYGLSKD